MQICSPLLAKRMPFTTISICIKTAATMSSVRERRRAQLPFCMRVQHACAISHDISGFGSAPLIVDMINRFGSTVSMQ